MIQHLNTRFDISSKFFRAYHSLDQIGFDVCFDILEAGLGTSKSENCKILGRVAADKGLSTGSGIVEGLDDLIALGRQDVAKEFLAGLLTIRNKRGL